MGEQKNPLILLHAEKCHCKIPSRAGSKMSLPAGKDWLIWSLMEFFQAQEKQHVRNTRLNKLGDDSMTNIRRKVLGCLAAQQRTFFLKEGLFKDGTLR